MSAFQSWNFSLDINVIPHTNVIFFGPVAPACITGGVRSEGINFYDMKASSGNFDRKTALFTHYGVFGHHQSCDSPATCSDVHCPDIDGARPHYGTSGLAEIRGNDFVVTLGVFPLPTTADVKASREAGAIAHEVGYNLGQRHGGPDCDPLTDPSCTYAPDQSRKPNYLSVMNYSYNFGIPVADAPGSVTPNQARTRIDFSHASLPTLDETSLVEAAGVSPGNPPPYVTDLIKYFSPGFGIGTRYGSTLAGEAINWNVDDPVLATPVQVNINDFPPGALPSEVHMGAEDWSRLKFDFQCDPKFLDGASPPGGTLATDEIDPEIAKAVDVLLPLLSVRVDVNLECIDIASTGISVPDVIYGSETFNVLDIDLSTLRLAEATAVSVSFSDEDGDGFLDLKGTYRTSEMSLTVQSTRAVVTGRLASGQSLQGEDAVRVRSGECCPAGQDFCTTGCADLSSDPNNCGGCGIVCMLTNASESCVSGICAIASCDLGFGDCDGEPTNGCETALDSPPNCGRCGEACDDGYACTLDSCQPGTETCLHAPIVLTEPGPVEFASNTSIQWPPTADADHWNSYRGTIPAGMLGSRPAGSRYDQVCFESADALGDGPTTSTDRVDPPLGTAFYYLVTGEGGCESPLGRATSGELIPNNAPCATTP